MLQRQHRIGLLAFGYRRQIRDVLADVERRAVGCAAQAVVPMTWTEVVVRYLRHPTLEGSDCQALPEDRRLVPRRGSSCERSRQGPPAGELSEPLGETTEAPCERRVPRIPASPKRAPVWPPGWLPHAGRRERLSQRTSRAATLAATIAISVLAGCSAIDPVLKDRIAAEAAPLTPSVEDDAAVAEVGLDAAEAGVPAPEAWPVAPDAVLEDYLSFALERNPAIHRAIREVEALGYRVPQVTSLDDPMVTIVPPTGDMIETAAGMMDGSVGVAQKIPFPGKLATRGRIAEQAARVALDRLADVRIRTVADVSKAFDDFYLADVSIGITERSAELLRQIRDVAAARYRAGLSTQQDVLRAEVELYGLTNRLITLEQQRATATARLNALMNRRIDAPLPPPRPLELEKVEWKLDQAAEQAVRENPRLAALRNQIQQNLEAVALARLQYFPDLNLGYTYTFIAAPSLSPVATGDDAQSVSLAGC